MSTVPRLRVVGWTLLGVIVASGTWGPGYCRSRPLWAVARATEEEWEEPNGGRR